MDDLTLKKNKTKTSSNVILPKFCCLCKLNGEQVVAFYYSLKNYYCLKHRAEAIEEIKKISNSKSTYVR